MKTHRLSLTSVTLINLNIMLGVGLFANTALLARIAGAFGPLAYALVGIALLPLIFSFMHLLRLHAQGSFFDYARPLGYIPAIIAGWGYFVAKLASCALALWVCTSMLQMLVPFLSNLPTLSLSLSILFCFTLLNLCNLRIGSLVQHCFVILKAIPIGIVLLLGPFYFSYQAYSAALQSWTSVINALPFVLYAFTGFEACCSLSAHVQDSEKNAPRALALSYGIGIGIVVAFQLLFFGATAGQLAYAPSYLDVFPLLLTPITSAAPILGRFLIRACHVGIAASALGAAYGIMYSNSWNLFRLTHATALRGRRWLAQLNRYTMPTWCIMVQSCIIALYLCVTQGNQIPLQQITSMGMVLTYALCTAALLPHKNGTSMRVRLLALASLCSCGLLVYGVIRSVLLYGSTGIVLLAALLMFGLYLTRAYNEPTCQGSKDT